ncbi:hypothetical protein JMJ35_010288 [Cladonia borealis]|uniref:MFS transporter n=1 Tax=Cladonia borealis TaxID=184061 RepID=A0AA39QQG7_9LECA|nr:hypothetical protein JMJ35_010288 [Cladonia borealis]
MAIPLLTRRRRLAPWVCILFAFLANLARRQVQIPLLRICELRACRAYSAKHDPSVIGGDGNVDDCLCKTKEIQSHLAYVIGVIEVLQIVIELVELIPFGILSDKYSRKLFLFLFSFSMEASSGWIMADKNVWILLGPVIASSTASISLWLPLWISIAVSCLAGLTVALLPDTRPVHHVKGQDEPVQQEPTETEALLDQIDNNSSEEMSPHPRDQGLIGLIREVKAKLSTKAQGLRLSLKTSRNFRLGLSILLVTQVGASNTVILSQYISVRYGWTLVQAGYLFYVKAVAMLLLYIVIIPVGLKYLTGKRNFSTAAANLTGTKISIVSLCIGALAISLSVDIWMFIPAIVVYVYGNGLGLFILSLLTSPEFGDTEEQNHAKTYSSVQLVEACGTLLSVPILTAALAAGINIGGIGLGMPFLLCALSYFIVGFIVWNLKVQDYKTQPLGDTSLQD